MKVGITGHQRLEDPSAWEWVRFALSGELDAMMPPLIGVSSLAIGADQLFAAMVTQRGGQLQVILPFPEYERTFDAQDIEAYRRMLSMASSVEILQTQGTDEDKYLAAGKWIVQLADVMIAIWDGKPAKGKGGTADIVAYALQRSIKVIHINPVDRSIVKK